MLKQYYSTEDFNSRRSVGHLLRQGGKLITARIEALFVEEDISFVQWVIIMRLREGLSITAADLSQHLCHDSGALTRVIDQMEERGLITRHRSTEDRRMVALALTQASLDTIPIYLPRVIALYNDLLMDFSREEVDQLIELLTRVNAKLLTTSLAKKD